MSSMHRLSLCSGALALVIAFSATTTATLAGTNDPASPGDPTQHSSQKWENPQWLDGGSSSGSSGSSGSSNSSLFDNKPLFDDHLFEDQNEPLFSKRTESQPNPQAAAATAEAAAVQKVQNKIDASFQDNEMRNQMKSCFEWMNTYLIRNGSRFPGVLQNDILWSAKIQLTELVPNNPYNWGNVQQSGEMGMPAYLNPDGTPQTGSPVWQNYWQEHLVSDQMNRINLVFNPGLNPQMVTDWYQNPPSDWQGTPGLITLIGNNQGFFIVWGAGRDGKPVSNPYNKGVYILGGNTYKVVTDQSAPNGF